jgi:GABA(A) receptor-associated protein
MFQRKFTFEERLTESSRVRAKYPDRVPVICGKSKKSRMEEIDKNKYLVPSDLTLGQFIYVIRKRLRLPAEKAVFLFINGTINANTATMNDMYYRYCNEDGFLYITYNDENVFGEDK